MFQFMAGYALSKSTGRNLLINKNWYLNPIFRHRKNHAYDSKRRIEVLDYRIPSQFGIEALPTPRDGRFEKIYLKLNPSVSRRIGMATERDFEAGEWNDCNSIRRLIGYFMSPKYFLQENPKSIFSETVNPVNPWIQNEVNSIRNSNGIGVHVRLGDYVALGDKVIPSENYFMQSIALLRAKLGFFAPLYIFSDEPKKVAALFPNLVAKANIINSPASITSVENLILLSNCDAFVCSNSTFSWWAARLSNSSPELQVRPSYFFTSLPNNDSESHLWDIKSPKIHPIFGNLIP